MPCIGFDPMRGEKSVYVIFSLGIIYGIEWIFQNPHKPYSVRWDMIIQI